MAPQQPFHDFLGGSQYLKRKTEEGTVGSVAHFGRHFNPLATGLPRAGTR